MKKKYLLLFIGCAFLLSSLHAQDKFPDKIRVILLGTFHYGATSDRNSTPFADLFSPKRQKELIELVASLQKVHPSKVFVESPPANQAKYDSLYSLYKKNELTDTNILRNEIVQIGFRLANSANLPAPVCVDYRQELPYDAMEKFEKGIGSDTTIQFPPFFSIPYPFTDSTKKLSLKKMSLSEYYVPFNDLYHRQQNEFDYLHYGLGYGYKDDYTGTEFTASWYNRNLKILTNIFRSLQPTDKCIVVVFGMAHTNTLRQFFENHPSFEIVELDKVL